MKLRRFADIWERRLEGFRTGGERESVLDRGDEVADSLESSVRGWRSAMVGGRDGRRRSRGRKAENRGEDDEDDDRPAERVGRLNWRSRDLPTRRGRGQGRLHQRSAGTGLYLDA